MASDLLKKRFDEIERLARAAGLKHYDVQFFEVPDSVIWEVASYGLPTRYSHWSFGKVYQYQRTQGEMGFSHIYELILNNDPSFAFLDKNNTDTINLMIAAHCFGHSDFFANNVMFKNAGEKNMVQVAKRHAEIIDQYRADYGDDEVDEWLDVALALEQHVDVYRGRRRERYPKRHVVYEERTASAWEDIVKGDDRDPLVKKVIEGIHIPPRPERDVLWFLSEYANLEPWQQRIFEIVHRESYYFYPQYRTKIMNEGWACMTGDTFVLTDKGYIRYKRLCEDYSGYRVATGKWTGFGAILQTVSDRHITAPQDTLRVTTEKGISFEGGKNHRVVGASANKRLGNVTYDADQNTKDIFLRDLSPGDFVQISIGADSWTTDEIKCSFDHPKYSRSKPFVLPETVNTDVAKFLGYFLSEGCTVKRGVQITNKDQELISDFCSVTKRIFGINPEVTPRTEDPAKFDCIVWCSAIVRFLEHLDIDLNHLSKQKQVPDIIMRSPKKVVAAFLSAYFAGDGGCYNENRIVLSTSSRAMAEQIGLLLLNFGIDYSFRENNKKGYDPNYHLVLTSKRNLLLYSKMIGFASVKRKQRCCERILKTNDNAEPHKGSVFAKIKEISEGFDVLYDITVPEYHHYVAQGAIHHNSYWHAELMRQYAFGNDNDYGVKDIEHELTAEEHLDFAAAHEKVVQPGMKMRLKVEVDEVDHTGRPTGKKIKKWHPILSERPGLFRRATRLNPYYVGFKMFRDIKERWDKYHEEGFREDEWGEKIPVTMTGDQKIRQVMEEEDDVSFMRNYLTEELATDLHLFVYGNNDKYLDDYGTQEEIQKRYKDNGEHHLGQMPIDGQLIENKTVEVNSKKLKQIINCFARGLSNYGVPSILIRRVDEAGLLRLEHSTEDAINIDIKYAEHVLRYVHRAWGRPVELIRKEKDRTWTLGYNGASFESDHQTPDYPEIVEDTDVPSSW